MTCWMTVVWLGVAMKDLVKAFNRLQACFCCSVVRISPKCGFSVSVASGTCRPSDSLGGIRDDQQPLPLSPGLQEAHMVDLSILLSVKLSDLVGDRAHLTNYFVGALSVGQELRFFCGE